MSIRRLIIGLAALIPAGLLAYALSAAEPKPAAGGLEEKEEKFDYTIEGETKHGTRKVVTLDLGGDVTMEFVRIPHGTFIMGSPDAEIELRRYEFDSEVPQHAVEITKDFYLGKYPVTKKQFARFVEAAKYKTEGETKESGGLGFDGGKDFKRDPKFTWRYAGFTQGDDHPVMNVSWNDATAFCKWAGDATKRRVALPTEAQWEYACRAGTTTRYFTGDKVESLDGSANISDRAFKKRFGDSMLDLGTVDIDDGYACTSPVGKFRPNPFGLYDMTGNVRQWCADYWSSEFYSKSDKQDPENTTKSVFRVERGGSWWGFPLLYRAGCRRYVSPAAVEFDIGFRVALIPD